ncbi:PD-(D/E)XK nuclease family protein [bacterium]|nr:PD-(D/E)XK nuclease family protein [bacterium]
MTAEREANPTLYLTSAPHPQATALVPGRLVVTPNPRAARALGVPHVSLQRLAQGLLARAGRTAIDALTAPHLLRDLALAHGFPDPAGTARRLAPVVAEVLRAGLDLEQLAAFDDPRVQQVARFVQGYLARLRELRLHDPAETYWLAIQGSVKRQSVLVTGYPRLGRDEEAFLLALAAPGSALILPGGEHDAVHENVALAERFEQAGWRVQRADLEAPQRPSTMRGWQLADQVAEVRAVLAHVKELLLGGTSPAEVAIAARDDAAHGPLVLAIAAEHGVPVHAEYQIPLSETRFGHWLGLLTEVIETNLPFEPTFRLLGHPLCRALNGEKRLEARASHPHGPDEWAALGVPTQELVWPEAATGLEWAQRLRVLLQRLGIVRRARHWAAETIAVGRFTRALDLLGERDTSSRSRAEFLQEVREALSILTTPAHPARGGVGLHTPLALFGARVKHLFVIGTAEDELPARLNDDPVLDFITRQRLETAGLPLETATSAARRERLTFDSLLTVASETLTFTCSRLQAGKARLPSPAFGWLGIKLETPEVPVASPEEGRRIKILSDYADEDAVLARARMALAIERRREAPGSLREANPHDGTSGIPVDWRRRTFSASQLSSLGQCPFRWYAQKVLRIKEPDEAIEGIEPQVRGLLYHKTLELACRAAIGATDPRQSVLDRLEASMLEAEGELVPELGYRLSDLPGWDARREEHLTVLRRAVLHEGFLDAGGEIAATEGHFKGEWRGFKVQGQVDRIDRVGGELVILDYKAGSAIYGKAQDASRKNTIDLQLPIYIEAAAPALYPGVAVREASYYTLSKPKRHRAEVDEPALELLLSRLKAHLEEGHFPVAPDLKRAACEYCEHGVVCRAGARLGRKEA